MLMRESPPHTRPKAIQTHQPHVCPLQNSRDAPQRKAAVSLIPTFATDNKAACLPPWSIDRNKPSISWRNGYSMAWWRGHSRHCLPGFRQSIWISKSSSPTHLVKMLRNRPLCYKLDRILSLTTVIKKASVNGPLSQVAESASGALKIHYEAVSFLLSTSAT